MLVARILNPLLLTIAELWSTLLLILQPERQPVWNHFCPTCREPWVFYGECHTPDRECACVYGSGQSQYIVLVSSQPDRFLCSCDRDGDRIPGSREIKDLDAHLALHKQHE